MKKISSKGRRLKNKALIVLGCVLFLMLVIFLYFHFIVGPLVVAVSKAQVDSVATTAISDAIYKVTKEKEYDYEDFIKVSYSSENKISSISTNSINLNNFARELSTESQILLDKVGEGGIDVPLGTFSGINALSALGPKVNLKLMPIGSVITSFESSFTSSGINQTKHSLYIVANITISVIMPLVTEKIDFITQVLICENIIVGDVPEFYFSSGNSIFK